MATTPTFALIRDDFPILSREVGGHDLVYLDSAATSQKPLAVLEAMDAYYREANANVRRGVYSLAADADRRFEAARTSVARLVNAPLDGLVVTKNVTEAINLVAWAWGVYRARRSLPALAIAMGFTTFTYGAIIGVLRQVQLANGWSV